MKDKIYSYEILELCPLDEQQVARLATCWNILRTCTDEQLASLEKQVDATIGEFGEESVGVYVGPTLPF